MSRFSIQIHNQHPILYIDSKPFHSLKNPYAESRLLKDIDFSKTKLLIVLGIGLGYPLVEVSKNFPHIQILPIFFSLEEKQLFFQYQNSVGLNIEQSFLFTQEKNWKIYLQQFLPQNIHIWIHPQYISRIKMKEVAQVYISIQKILKQQIMNSITDAAFGFRWWRNCIRNYYHYPIKGVMIKHNANISLPTLLIGSGYSAYLQISYILEVQKSYYIIAVLPVLELLLSYDIIPDMVVMTDGGSPNRFYTSIQALPSTSIFICYLQVYSQVLQWFSGEILMINGGLEIESLLTPELDFFPSGGSVANTMLDIASCISKNIYYTGFDFSYSYLHPHYPGSPLETSKIYQASRTKTIETVFAKQVYTYPLQNNIRTTPVLKAYKEYFQQQIEEKDSFVDIKPLKIKNTSKEPIFKQIEFISCLIAENIKNQRINQLIAILQQCIKTGQSSQLIKILTARAILKKQDIIPFLHREIQFLESLLTNHS